MFTAVLFQTMMVSGGEELIFNATSNYTATNSSSMSATLVEGGEETDVEVEGYEVTAGFDAVGGALFWLIGLVALGVVAGISVLGSGIKEYSVRLLVKVVGYYAFWMLVSFFAREAFSFFPMGFGWVLYLVMTVMFSFGVMEQT